LKVVFSALFKADLLREGTRYGAISPKLGDDFHDRVKETARVIAKLHGGDHAGPHGFPCRKCRPFPFLICYQIEGDTLYVLGLVHERRHPEFLEQKLAES